MPNIQIYGKNWIKLEQMRLTIQRELGKNTQGKYPRVSWNLVLDRFFKELKQIKDEMREVIEKIVGKNLDLENQVRELGGKVSHKDQIIETTLLNLSKQTAAPVMFQANPQMLQQSAPIPSLNAPPLPPALHMTDEEIDALQDEDAKINLQDELIETINGKDITKLLKAPPKKEMKRILKERARRKRAKKPIKVDKDFKFHTEEHPDKFKKAITI